MRLGPFSMLERIGSGGMGEVWSGVHLGTDQPVAIKVIHSALASNPQFRQAFTDEVRAVAGLRHRGIVEVLDYGSAPADSPFVAGSPYLVMARADASVRERPPLGWHDVREVLLEVLAALAHAHARGVVHLDIKPGNLLRFGDRVALTDFGVAAFVGETLDRDAVRGSAAYMAPEQFAGRWRDYGPATDLYGLGTVAWELLCGQVPFQATDPTTLGNLKHTAPPPRLPEELAPAALRTWLETLLATEIGDRYARAADAADALTRVPADADVTVGVASRETADATMALSTFWDGSEETLPSPRRTESRPAPPRAPAGASWQSRHEDSQLLKEALGLGLFELRPPPFAGRLAERERLWEALGRVEQQHMPQVAIVEGPEGVGSSELCSWVARRADEVGAAIAIVAGPNEPLDALWRRVLSVAGLAPDPLFGQLIHGQNQLPDALASAVAALVGTATALSPQERLAIQVELLEHLATQRPIALVLDRLDADSEATALAQAVLERVRGGVWLLVSVRTEQLSEGGPLAAAIERLEAAGAERIRLGPLPDGDIRTMIERLVRLDGDAASQLMERASGHPQMVVRVLGQWIRDGQLTAGPRGFSRVGPAESAPTESPWTARADAVIGGDAGRGRALERAAILGDTVERRVWRQLCDDLDPEALGAIEDALYRGGLARPASDAWTFAHPLLKQALIDRARSGGRLRDHHQRAAEVLESMDVAYSLRRGDHLFEAACWFEAFETLLGSVILLWNHLHLHRARHAIFRARRAAEHLEEPARPLRRVKGVEALFAVHAGAYDEAMGLAQALIDESTRADDDGTLARGLRARGMVYQLRGAFADAAADLERAADIVKSQGDPDLASAIEVVWMQTLLQSGKYTEAQRVAERFAPVEVKHVAVCEAARGILLSYLGDQQGAIVCYQACIAICRERGLRVPHAGAVANLGDSYRVLGDLVAAEHCVAEAIELGRALGLSSEPLMRLNHAQILLAMGEPDRAWDVLEGARAGLERLGRHAMLGAAHAVSLRCLAMRGDWDRWDRHFERSVELLDGVGLREPEVVEAYEEAGRLAFEAGLQRRATEARARADAHRISKT